MFKRVRKAVVAGFGAGLSAGVVFVVQSDRPLAAATLSAALGAFVAAGIPVGWATWQVRNETGGTVAPTTRY